MKKLLIILLFVPLVSFGQDEENKSMDMTVDEYMMRGKERTESNNFNGAIKDFTAALKILPDYFIAYTGRAYAKLQKNDYYGAVADYSKAIELPSGDTNTEAYFFRGQSKLNITDYYGAICDYAKTIEIEAEYEYYQYSSSAYANSGLIKEQLGDLNGACSDWKNAASLGDEKSAQWLRDQCN